MTGTRLDLSHHLSEFQQTWGALQADLSSAIGATDMGRAYEISGKLVEAATEFVSRWGDANADAGLLGEVRTNRLVALQTRAMVGSVAGHWPASRAALETLVWEGGDAFRTDAAFTLGCGLVRADEYRAAIPYFRVVLADSYTAPQQRVQALSMLATCYRSLEDPLQASALARQAAAEATQLGLETDALRMELQALYFETLADSTGAARDHLRQAADALKKRAFNDGKLRVEISQNLADYYRKIGQTGAAKDEMEQALALTGEDLQLRWSTLQSFSRVVKKAEEGIAYAEQAAETARNMGVDANLAQSLNLLISWRLEVFDDGRQIAQAQLEMDELRKIADSETVYNTLNAWALAEAKSNEFDRALATIAKAQRTSPDKVQDCIYMRAAVLKNAERYQEALQVAREGLARLNPEDRHIRALTQRADLNRVCAQSEAALGNLPQALLHAEHSRALGNSPANDWRELQHWLDGENVAAVYLLTMSKSTLCLIAEPGKGASVERFPLTEPLVTRLSPGRNVLDAGVWNGKLAKMCAELGPVIAQGVEPVLKRNRTVYLFPESALAGFPFAALSFSDGSRLVDHCALVFAPALRVAKELSERVTARKSLLVVSAGEEGGVSFRGQSSAIAALPLWRESRELADANFKSFVEAAPSADVVHLACHGTVASGVEEGLSASVIELHAHEPLTAKQVSALRLQASLVFLNACRSGVFRAELYGEVGGFWQAFLDAGAVSVIATLTFVNPDAAHRLAEAFYREWVPGQVSKAEALRRVQAELAKTEKNELAWASQVLVGCHR